MSLLKITKSIWIDHYHGDAFYGKCGGIYDCGSYENGAIVRQTKPIELFSTDDSKLNCKAAQFYLKLMKNHRLK